MTSGTGNVLGDGDQGSGHELQQHDVLGSDGECGPGHPGDADGDGNAGNGAGVSSDVYGRFLGRQREQAR
jgi:hypothetical protein